MSSVELLAPPVAARGQVPRTAQAAVDIVYHLSIGLRSIECEQW